MGSQEIEEQNICHEMASPPQPPPHTPQGWPLAWGLSRLTPTGGALPRLEAGPTEVTDAAHGGPASESTASWVPGLDVRGWAVVSKPALRPSSAPGDGGAGRPAPQEARRSPLFIHLRCAILFVTLASQELMK